MGIYIVLVSTFMNLCSFYYLDYIMTIAGKPLIKRKYIRYLFVHSGRYTENNICINGVPILLPDKNNVYTISKSVLKLEICCYIYAISSLVLEVVNLVLGNRTMYLTLIPLHSLYFLFALVLLIYSIIRRINVNNLYKLQQEKKFETLLEAGIRNKYTVEELMDEFMESKQLLFQIYGISFQIQMYKNQWRLLDISHRRVLMDEKDLNCILDNLSINGKSLRQLWQHIELSTQN